MEQLSFQPEPGLATGDSPLPDSIGTETAPLRGEAPRSELFEPKSEQRTPYPPATSVRGGEKAAPLSAKQRGDAHRASPPAAPPPVLCPDPCWWHLDAAPLVAAHGRVGEVPGARSCSRLQPEETGGNQFLSWHISWCVKECQVSWTRAGWVWGECLSSPGDVLLGSSWGQDPAHSTPGPTPSFPLAKISRLHEGHTAGTSPSSCRRAVPRGHRESGLDSSLSPAKAPPRHASEAISPSLQTSAACSIARGKTDSELPKIRRPHLQPSSPGMQSK